MQYKVSFRLMVMFLAAIFLAAGVAVQVNPALAASLDSYEPDNEAAIAKVIMPGVPQKGRSIYPAGDIDWLKFTTTSVADVYLEAYGYPAQIVIGLYQDATKTYAMTTSSSGKLTLPCLPAGTYWLKLYAYTYSDSISTVYDYDIYLSAVPKTVAADAKEPNDTPQTATPVTSGAAVKNLSIVPSDDSDWFTFTTGAESNLSIYAYGASSSVYISLYDGKILTDPNAYSIASSSYSSLYKSALAAGTYYVKVRSSSYGYVPQIPNYTLSVGYNIPANLSEDQYEPDNSETEAVAVRLGVSHDDHSLFKLGTDNLPTTDYDYMKFLLVEPSDILVTITSGAGPRFDISLWSNDSNSPSFYTYDTDTLSAPGLLPGTYYLRLVKGNYSDPDVENYSVLVSSVKSALTYDAAEPDNSRSTAKSIGIGQKQENKTIFPGNESDWYYFSLSSMSDVTITVEPPPGIQPRLGLYDNVTGSEIAYTYNSRVLKKFGLKPGNYSFYVQNYSSETPFPYSVIVDSRPTVFEADSSEPNDFYTQAILLESGTPLKDLSIYPAGTDEDWFKFVLTKQSNIQISRTIPYGESVQMRLYKDPNLPPFQESTYAFTLYNQPAGTYYLKVVEDSGASTVGYYALTLTLTDVGTPDAFEPDDSQSLAKLLVPSTAHGPHNFHHGADYDWYRIDLTKTSGITVEASFNEGASYPSLYYYLYRNNSSYVGYSYGVRYIKSELGPGSYFLRVSRDYGTFTDYTLTLRVKDLGLPAPVVDSFEPNDNWPDSATVLTLPYTSSNHSLNPVYDEDWYKVTLTENSDLSVQVINLTPTTKYLYTYLYRSSNLGSSIGYEYWNQYDTVPDVAGDLPPGDYYISAVQASGITIERYDLQVSSAPTGVARDAAEAGEGDGTYLLATTLTSGVTVENRTIDNRYDQDWFKIVLTEKSKLDVKIVKPLGGYVYLYIYNTDGVVSEDYDYYAWDSQVFYDIPAGTYYMKMVQQSQTDACPGYSLTVRTQASSPGDAYEPDSTYDIAKAIVPGIPATGRSLHNPNDVDWYRFTLNETSDVIIGATPEAAGRFYYYLRKASDPWSYIKYGYYYDVYSKSKIVQNFLPPGDYFLSVSPYDSTAGSITGSYSISIDRKRAAAVDLKVMSVAVSPTTGVQTGSVITFDVTVKNEGEALNLSTYLQLYIDGNSIGNTSRQVPDSNPVTYEVQQGYLSISSFAAGETKVLQLTWFAVPRSYSFKVRIDNNDAVAEIDETNNHFIGLIPFELNFSDLAFTKVTVSPDPATPGSITHGTEVKFIATMKNSGDPFLTSHWYRLSISYLDESSVERWNYIDSVSTGGFTGGETRDVTLKWIAGPGEHKRFKIEADVYGYYSSYGYVSEKDETNNTWTGDLNITLQKSDLRITNVAVSPTTGVSIGTPVNFDVDVLNDSGAYIDVYHKYDLYIDSVLVSSAFGYGIEAGGTKTVRLTWNATAGTHTNFKIVADSTNRVPEGNDTNTGETNNEYSASLGLTVSDCDLVVTALDIPGGDITTAALKDGQPINLLATVKNNETGKAIQTFAVALMINGTEAVAYRYINGLDAGASQDVAFTWTVRGGATKISVVADSRNEVVEKDETNNGLEKTLSAFGAPDYTVTNLYIEPSTGLKDGSQVKAVAEITNSGTGGTLNSSWVQFSVDGQSWQQVTMGGLAAGAKLLVSAPLTLKAGHAKISATADVNNKVGESNETNNTAEYALPALELANIAVLSLKWTNDELYDGTELIAKGLIKNVGSGATAQDIRLEFLVGSTTVATWNHVGGLAAGATQEVVGKWIFRAGDTEMSLRANNARTITETNYADNEFKLPIPTVAKPDLEIRALGWDPRLFELNQDVTVFASIENTGEGKTARDFGVSFKVDGNTVRTISVTRDLAKGQIENVQFTWRASYGTEMSVTVDPNNIVPEDSVDGETNNTKSEKLPEIPRPDLKVNSLTWDSLAGVNPGDTVKFYIQLENVGKSPAKAFTVGLNIKNGTSGTQRADGRYISGGLWPGLTIDMEMYWQATAGASREVEFAISTEPYDADKTNDTIVKPLADDIKGADFTVTGLSMENAAATVITSSDSVKIGDVLTFKCTVNNTGNGAYSANVPVGFYINGKVDTVVDIPEGLAAGASKAIQLTWTVPEAPAYNLTVTADPFRAISEVSETNNYSTANLPTVPAPDRPDLVISSVTSTFDNTKTDYKDGDEIEFTVTMGNTGTVGVSKDFSLSYGIGFFRESTVITGGIGAGGTKTYTFKWKISTGTNNTLYMSVDDKGQIPEKNESNNSANYSLAYAKTVQKPLDFLVSLSSMNPSSYIPVGGYATYAIDITSRLEEAEFLDISVSGLDSLDHSLTQNRVYAVAGERTKVLLEIGIPKTHDASAVPAVGFDVLVTNAVLSVTAEATLNIVSSPVPTGLRPDDGAKLGTNDVLVTWSSVVEGDSWVYYKKVGDAEFTKTGDSVPATKHGVLLENLERNSEYTYYVESAGPGGTYSGSAETRTFSIGTGISFSRESYEFTVEKNYNQLVQLVVKNDDTVPHILLLEVLNENSDLIVGFLGGGSVDYPVPINPGYSLPVTLALHLQDATKPVYDIIAKITSTRAGEVLTSTASVKVNVKIPIIDYTIEEVETNPVTLAKKVKITNKGDEITDFNILLSREVRDAIVMSPDISHYKLKVGETLYFDAIPVLGHPVFLAKFGVSGSGTVDATAERKVMCTIQGLVKGLGQPRYGNLHSNVGTRSVQMLTSAGVDLDYTAPAGTTPRRVGFSGMNYEAQTRAWHCTNRPLVSVDVPVPPLDVSEDPLYIDFIPSTSWEQKPHDVYIYLNDHLVASFKNQIPSGLKKIDFDPAILNIPKAGVAKNRVDIRTVHMNGGHYVVASDIKFLMRLNKFDTYVMAGSDEEAWQLAEKNLPENIKKAPSSITFDPIETTGEKLIEGTPTTLKIKPKLPNGQAAKKIQCWVKVGGKEIALSDSDDDGTYEGVWVPEIEDSVSALATAKGISALATKCITVEVHSKNGSFVTTQCIEESDLVVSILTPESGFQINAGHTARVRAKLTNKEGNPVTDPDMITASFSGGEAGGAMTAIGGGEFFFDWTPDAKNVNYPGPCRISVSASHSKYGTATDSVSGKVIKKTTLKIIEITCKYAGHVFYIDGVNHNVEYSVKVDWGTELEPGSVIFKTPKSSTSVKAPYLSFPVKHTLNMGTTVGIGGKLQVKAISKDSENESEWKEADFTIAQRVPAQAIMMLALLEGSSYTGTERAFAYGSGTGFNMNIFSPKMDEEELPDWLPIFGKKPFFMNFVPSLGTNYGSDGKASYELAWDVDRLKKTVQEPVPGKVAGIEYKLIPKVAINGECTKDTGKWKWGGSAGVEGSIEASKSFPFTLLIGPAPVPMFFKISLKLSANASVGIKEFGAGKWEIQGGLTFGPYARGSVGAGFDGRLAVEGWIGGGANYNFEWPNKTYPIFGFKGVNLLLNAGFTVTAWIWSWEKTGLEWKYPGEPPSADALGGVYAFSAQDFDLNQRPKLMPRNYSTREGSGIFVTEPFGKPGMVSALSELENPKIAALATSVFPYSNPSISNSGDSLFLAWIDDDSTRTSKNRTVLKTAKWTSSGTTGTWSNPKGATVTDYSVSSSDGTGDFTPSLKAFPDGKVVVAWENQKSTYADGVTTEFETQFIPNFEISAAVLDGTTWTTTSLTDNAWMDTTPRVSGPSSDKVLVTWIANESNAFVGSNASPNKLMYRTFNGTAWSDAKVAATIPYGVTNYSVSYNGTKAELVYAADTEGITQNQSLVTNEDTVNAQVASRELFQITFSGSTWTLPKRLTTNTLPDDNPMVGIDKTGAFIMVWLKGNELTWVRNFDMGLTRVVRKENEFSSNLANARMASSAEGRIALVWGDSTQDGADLFTVFYDPDYNVWGEPKRLTNDKDTERNVAVSFVGLGDVVTVYNRNVIDNASLGKVVSLGQTVEIIVPQTIDTDLYMMKYALTNNLALEKNSLFVLPANPLPGSGVTLEVMAVNRGDKAVKNVPVAFYNGDPAGGGTLISTVTITDTMAPNAVKKVSVGWTIPQDAAGISLYAVIDPEADTVFGDDIRSDNSLSITAVKPDLAVASMLWAKLSATEYEFKAVVANTGAIATTATTVKFIDPDNGDATLGELAVTALAPGASVTITYTWDVAATNRAAYRVTAFVDPANGLAEYDEKNNLRTISARGNVQDIKVEPSIVSFGLIAINSNYAVKTVDVANAGGIDLTINGTAYLTGESKALYTIIDDKVSGTILKPGERSQISIRFSPVAVGGPKQAYLVVPSNDPDTPKASVSLTGTGSEILLKSIFVNPTVATVKGGETFDLSKISVGAVFSDGTVGPVLSPVWSVVTTGDSGSIVNGIYSAPNSTATIFLKASYTQTTTTGTITKTAQLEVRTVSPAAPVLSTLDVADAPPAGTVTLKANEVTVGRNCKVTWTGYDKDTAFGVHLFWTLDSTIAETADAIKTAMGESKIFRITPMQVVDSRFSATALSNYYDWNVSGLRTNTTLFTQEAGTVSEPLYVYAVASDNDNPVVVKKAAKAVRLSRPAPSTVNAAPSFAFTGLTTANVTTSGTAAQIEFKVADADKVAVSLSFYPEKDDARAISCVSSTGAVLMFYGTPKAATLDGTTIEALSWDVSDAVDGSYYIMATVTDNVNAPKNYWSDYRVVLARADSSNIAPKVEWVAPAFRNKVTSTGGDVTISFKIRDENGDKLDVALYYNKLNSQSQGITALGSTIEFTGTEVWQTKTVTFDTRGLSNGAYYILAAVKEDGKPTGIFKYWTPAPVVIDKASGIGYLSLGNPEADPDDAGKYRVTVGFNVAEDATATLSYGLKGVTAKETKSEAASTSHALAMTGLTAGEVYFFMVKAVTQSGAEYVKDNRGNLFSFKVPVAASVEAEGRWLRGKINHDKPALVTVYLTRTNAGTVTLSRPLVTVSASDGTWAVNLATAIDAKTGTIMNPIETDLVRVLIIAGDGRTKYIEGIGLTGLEFAKTAFTGLAPIDLGGDGSGIDLPSETIEHTIDLKKGFNLVALPVEPTTQLTANGVMTLLGDNAVALYYYSAEEGYKSYSRIEGGFLGTDFDVDISIGFFVKMSAAGTLKVTGKKIDKGGIVSTLKGFNMITVSYGRDFPASTNTDLTAIALLKEMGPDGIAVYAYIDGGYKLVSRTGDGDSDSDFYAPYGDFTLTQGSGYFVKTKQDASFSSEKLEEE